MNIKVITTKDQDDPNPRVNMIGPDPVLQQFALLPSGTVPEMILIHNDDSHFDLLVSMKSRLASDAIDGNVHSHEHEFAQLKQKYDELKHTHEDLKTAYKESLETIATLKKTNETSQRKRKTAKVDKLSDVFIIENEDDLQNSEEEILLASKQSGFARVGPQVQPVPNPSQKIDQCEICNKTFLHMSELVNHMDTHSNDGDWSCNDCSFQTNSMNNLIGHIEKTGHKSDKVLPPNPAQTSKDISCNFCDKTFMKADIMIEHRKNTHKTFKPCRNKSNCPYQDNCLYSHKVIIDNTHICYECGDEMTTFIDLMNHRRTNHQMRTCTKFQENNCMFTSESCWYDHGNTSKQKTETTSSRKTNSNSSSQPPVFQDPPVNLAPPEQNPSMATWLKMMTMMTELNAMMTMMKESGKFLS